MKKSLQIKRAWCGAAALAGMSLLAQEPAATATFTVDLGKELGVIKPMNAVNNGPTVSPVGGDQKKGNFEEYAALEIPLARTHDSINAVSGGAHCLDVDAVFPDFDADENDPKSYDFVFTDHYLDAMVRAGTKPFFRLGQTIEHGPKKYGVLPPKDFAKWARVCEHIIRHYNEGWGWATDREFTTKNIVFSNQFDIVWWEIWNEPDLDGFDFASSRLLDTPPKNPRTWGGTPTEFFEFYATVAKHLKGKFPKLMIGGPAVACLPLWSEAFLEYCRAHQVPLDFFSWHGYGADPFAMAAPCDRYRKLLDDYGYTKTLSVYNEWNYVLGWVDDWVPSLEVETGKNNMICAALIAAVMSECQAKPLDLLMFYDAGCVRGMNALFDFTTHYPRKGYYPFYAWKKLVKLGTEVKVDFVAGRGRRVDAATGGNVAAAAKNDTRCQFHATAAKSRDGKHGAVLVTRYNSDRNVLEMGEVFVKVPGADLAQARCHLTDDVRTYTEVEGVLQSDGSLKLKLLPCSFALVEW